MLASSWTETNIIDANDGSLLANCNSGGVGSADVNQAFTPDSHLLLRWWIGFSGTEGPGMFDAETGRRVHGFGPGHLPQHASNMVLSPDGKRVLGAFTDRSMRLYDVATGQELYRFTGHNQIVTAVAFSPDGTMALSACKDGNVRLFNIPKTFDSTPKPSSTAPAPN